MKIIIYITIYLFFPLMGIGQIIEGTIFSKADGQPLSGVNINVKGHNKRTSSNRQGVFTISLLNQNPVIIEVSHIGFIRTEIKVEAPFTQLNIFLAPDSTVLKEVVISTGYQRIGKQKTTGSFSQIDNELINRRIGTNILPRLQDVVPGLLSYGGDAIRIRGQSTIFANAEPLIIVDNFPYELNLESINPNDVENITVLKDAAAASIWGAKAGNGVIVITTKKGQYNRSQIISMNSSLNVIDKPDQFYVPKMSSADYIDIEKRLFDEGYYTSTENSGNQLPLSPVVELLIKKRDNNFLEADALIEKLKKQDLRNDYGRYLNRLGLNQQYSLNMTAGKDNMKYYVSSGYDQNRFNQIGNNFNRLTFKTEQTYLLLRQKLELTTGLSFSETKRRINQPAGLLTGIAPYATLVDEFGNPKLTSRDYREAFLIESQNNGFLNWGYSPLEEVKNTNNQNHIIDYRLNTSLKYNLIPGLDAQVLYQYRRNTDQSRNLYGEASYYTRDLINQFTQVNTDGSLTLPIPTGGIFDMQNVSSTVHNARGQLSLNRSWKSLHNINALAGMEVYEQRSLGNNTRLYGYNEETSSSKTVDYLNSYRLSYSTLGNTSGIPNYDAQTDLTDRFLSYYANVTYTFNSKYTISGSGRIDKSNLFGVKTNQKAVPLYSAGLGWSINNEDFYTLRWLPVLRMRATLGYNGNIDKSLTALLTGRLMTGLAYPEGPKFAEITNAPNPELRWERIKVINLGIEFALHKNILSGSLDYYHKYGIDLMGQTPFPSSTGITTFRGNTANTKVKGIDLSLNSLNLNKRVKWISNLVFGYSNERVTRYLVESPVSHYVQGIEILPKEGKPLTGIYSYRWAGLDPQTGNPQGFFDGELSTDYLNIVNDTDENNIVYNGPGRPEVYGSVRNTISYKNFSISANISYKFGYFFRKKSISYGHNYGLGGHGDYYKRWQKPGDELGTNVPSIPVISNNNRDYFYLHSEVLIESGDHVRLQDVNLSYTLNGLNLSSRPTNKKLQLYLYADNIGLLWASNSSQIDPMYPSGPPPKSIALGLKLNL